MSNKLIYVADSNVLVDYVAHYIKPTASLTAADRQRIARIADFCDRNQNPIFVPDLVWSEFLGVMLHKGFDSCPTYADYQKWFRDRQMLIQQIEHRLVHPMQNLTLYHWPENAAPNPFKRSEELLTDPQLIDQASFNFIDRGKCFDGIDGAIMLYANQIAHDHPETKVVLYSGDRVLSQMIPRLQRRYRWIANNLSGFWSRQDRLPAGRDYSDLTALNAHQLF